MTNTRAEVILKWADGGYLFALKVPQIDELQRVTAKAVAEAMTASGVPTTAIPKAILEACGIGSIWSRLASGTYFRSDVAETIRLGLIGGGMDAVRAKTMVETYVDSRPLASREDVKKTLAGGSTGAVGDAVSNCLAAFQIVDAAIYGVQELKGTPQGKAPAGAPTADMSTFRPSIEPGAPSSELPPRSET